MTIVAHLHGTTKSMLRGSRLTGRQFQGWSSLSMRRRSRIGGSQATSWRKSRFRSDTIKFESWQICRVRRRAMFLMLRLLVDRPRMSLHWKGTLLSRWLLRSIIRLRKGLCEASERARKEGSYSRPKRGRRGTRLVSINRKTGNRGI